MNNPDMADIREEYKTKKETKSKPRGNQKTTNFKRNVPKRLRKEWGERMDFLRSL